MKKLLFLLLALMVGVETFASSDVFLGIKIDSNVNLSSLQLAIFCCLCILFSFYFSLKNGISLINENKVIYRTAFILSTIFTTIIAWLILEFSGFDLALLILLLIINILVSFVFPWIFTFTVINIILAGIFQFYLGVDNIFIVSIVGNLLGIIPYIFFRKSFKDKVDEEIMQT